MPANLLKPRKRLEAQRRLIEMIGSQKLWGERLAGERELAAELGVGRSTLRAALAALESEGHLDRRHGSGTYVAGREAAGQGPRTARVAVIAETHWEDPAGWNYYGEMIRGFLGLAPRLRVACEVLTLDSPEDRPRLEDSREMRRFSGFISVAVIDRGLLSWLAGLGRGPVVLLDHQVRDLPVVSVVDGSFEGARAVTRHLLRLGHRRIGFLDHHNRAESNSEKHAGYAAALDEAGIGTDERLVVVPPRAEWVPPGSAEVAQVVEAAVERLLALDGPPTALFGFDDYRALPAIEALERRGRRVGRDFAVAGFGDSAFQKGYCDRLTSSRINVRRMGQEALRAALNDDRGGGRTVIVPNRLMIRGTSCPPSRSSATHQTARKGE